MAISANGSKPGSGILWETTGNRSDPTIPATLHAFDAGNLANEIWNSNMTGGADSVGMFAKFANPTVADGKVFVPTWSGALSVYGLRNSERGKGRTPIH
jgi:outer membrane protein assembly factor BamB